MSDQPTVRISVTAFHLSPNDLSPIPEIVTDIQAITGSVQLWDEKISPDLGMKFSDLEKRILAQGYEQVEKEYVGPILIAVFELPTDHK